MKVFGDWAIKVISSLIIPGFGKLSISKKAKHVAAGLGIRTMKIFTESEHFDRSLFTK